MMLTSLFSTQLHYFQQDVTQGKWQQNWISSWRSPRQPTPCLQRSRDTIYPEEALKLLPKRAVGLCLLYMNRSGLWTFPCGSQSQASGLPLTVEIEELPPDHQLRLLGVKSINYHDSLHSWSPNSHMCYHMWLWADEEKRKEFHENHWKVTSWWPPWTCFCSEGREAYTILLQQSQGGGITQFP